MGNSGPFAVYDRGDGIDKSHFVVRFNKLMSKFTVLPGTVVCTGFDRPVQVRLFQKYIIIIDKAPVVSSANSGDNYYSDLLAFSIYDSSNNYTKMDYRVGRTYTITLDSTIEDINGNRLGRPFSFSFTPEPYFRVVGFRPRDRSTDVDAELYPVIFFNSSVDQSINSSIQFAPAIYAGWQLSYYDSTIVTTAAPVLLKHSTAYTLTVQQDARDAAGRQVSQSYSTNFTTVSFRLLSSYPTDGMNVRMNQEVGFNFSGVIDTGSVRGAFQISPIVSANFAIFNRSFYFWARENLSPNTRYTVTLSTSLMAHDSTHIPRGANFSFTTAQPRVESTYPWNSDTNVVVTNNISINFSGAIDTSTVRTAISASPDFSRTYEVFQSPFSSNVLRIIPAPPLSANTTYTISISTALKLKGGWNIISPYSFSFKTAR